MYELIHKCKSLFKKKSFNFMVWYSEKFKKTAIVLKENNSNIIHLFSGEYYNGNYNKVFNDYEKRLKKSA